MALVVEDGTGLATAESFISVAAALTYLGNRGNATFETFTDAEHESALRRATDYMEQVYRLRWAGYRTSSTQALSWPRTLVPQPDAPGGYRAWPFYYATNFIPPLVQQACALLAAKVADGTDLSPDLGRNTSSEKVDVIEVHYEPGGRQYTKFRAVDNMLQIFMSSNSGGMNLSLARS
jgi:hypothetical protein